MALDQWSAVALDSQIRPASSNPVKVHDQPVALWRSASGAINAWEDRCPHRGMRLSLGFVEGDRLRCIYHGWGYAPDGQCTVIPAHPDLVPPKTICATRYCAESRYGLVWANLAREPEAALPDLGADEGWTALRSIYLARPAEAARAALAAGLAEWGETGEGPVPTVRLEDGTVVAAALQPVDAGATGIHFTARGPGAATAQGRHDLVRRIVALRTAIETL